MAILHGLLCAFTFFHVTVSCVHVLSTNINPVTSLEELDPSNIYLHHKSICELSTVECSSLFINPCHLYDSGNYDARKRTASYPQIPSLDCPTTLLVFMLKCGDVHPHPGPSTDTIDFSCLNGKGLHFLHLNIRSLPNKIDELRTIIHNTKAAVVGISESWLDHTFTDEEIRIDGFCTLRNDRNREGGGVCTLVHNEVWFELLMPKSKPIMIRHCLSSTWWEQFCWEFRGGSI